MKKAVILFSMGGPGELKDIPFFLYRLFSDPSILKLPFPARQILALILSLKRKNESRRIFQLMGGKSPLLSNTQNQAAALEESLATFGRFHCLVAMSYMPPFIEETIEKALALAPEEIILLPLYPQYSTATTETVFREADRALQKRKTKKPVRRIEFFYKETGFIVSWVDKIRAQWLQAKKRGEPKLLLSAHGLPESFVKKGDPYPFQCEQTAQAIIEKLSLPNVDWVLCYQSRVGPMKWIGPSTEKEIIDAASAQRPIVIAPISFVSEHSETIVELGMDLKERALRLGCPLYLVVETPQTHPAFIEGLRRLVTSF